MGVFVHAMDPLLSLDPNMAAVIALLIGLLLFVVFTLRARRGHRFALRSIPAYERIKQLASHAAESGQPIHIGMGTGQLGGDATPEASMGITVFDYVAHHAATSDQPVSATVGDPTILPMAQGILLAARGEAGFPERYTGREVHFYGNDPLAYGAGVLAALQQRDHLASILLGRYGSEGLWIAETTRRHEDIVQLGGTVDPAAATLMRASLDDAVFGEEMFAAGAYLHRASHLGSLAMQDGARILIVIGIIVGVVMTSLGYW